MALTALQRKIVRLIAKNRIAGGESYVAGGVALNEVLCASRISEDVDLFHDSEEALLQTWDADRKLLEGAGFEIRVLRERGSFVEAEAAHGEVAVRMQWARDSAFRFFPLVSHPELGLTLHPFDLATNKVLALVGRLEVRDWVDVIECDRGIQPLGYLAWAACGKDPGFSPESLLEHAARTSRYSAEEVTSLAFDGDAPDAAVLSRSWQDSLQRARETIHHLPPPQVGTCVLAGDGSLFRGDLPELQAALQSRHLRYHRGKLRGALPSLMNEA